MSEVQDTELRGLLFDQAAKERRAFRRATLYMVIPVLIGLLLIGISAFQLIRLERDKTRLSEGNALLRTDNEGLKKDKDGLLKNKEALLAQIRELEDRKTTTTGELETRLALLRETEDRLRQVEQALAEAERTLQNISERKGDAVQEAQLALRNVKAATGGRWVVVGADRTLKAAQERAQKVARLGFPGVSIYSRQRAFRTVVEFSDENEARAKLPAIRERLGEAAYQRDPAQWCPNAQKQGDYFKCSN
jgi:DNA repair exonuclease SbcCD ATPase subunit